MTGKTVKGLIRKMENDGDRVRVVFHGMPSISFQKNKGSFRGQIRNYIQHCVDNNETDYSDKTLKMIGLK